MGIFVHILSSRYKIMKIEKEIKGIEGIGILLYRGYTSRRGIAVAVVEEITVNKKGKIIDDSLRS